MTAEELALMGYQPGQTSSLDLNAAQSSVTPQDLQQFYAMAGNPQAGAPDVSQLNPQPTFIDPAVLNSLSALQSQYSSDPNGFTSDSSGPQPASDPNGLTTGSDSLAGTVPTAQPSAPAGDPADQGNVQPQPQQPKLTPWQQYLTERGIGPNSVVDMASHRELLKGFNAQQLKQLEMSDPEKQLKLLKAQQELAANNPAALAAEQNSSAQAKLATQFDTIAKDQATASDAERLLGQIDSLANDKNLASAVGFSSVLPVIAGTPRAGVQAKINQLSGQAFLEAIPYLKGIGRITEMEAKNATAAIQRASNTKQSLSDYQQALSDFRDVVKTAQDRSLAAVARNPSYKAYLLAQDSINSNGAPSSAASVPMIKTIPGRGTFQSLGNGQWKQIQ